MIHQIDYASVPHARELSKPNEDRVLADAEKGIFIVLDGVTRVHDEYAQAPFTSAAGEVSDLFLKEVHRYLAEHIDEENKQTLLEKALALGNCKIAEYRAGKSLADWVFYPATLGIVSLLCGRTLHYAYAGDCLGLLLRGNGKTLFGRQLTLQAVDLHGVSKKERYEVYCNHPENPLSYAVFNGDETAMDGVEYSSITLCKGDTVLLASDGVARYLQYEKNATLLAQTAQEIIEASVKYDLPPFATYSDDKALIKLSL